MTMIQPRKDTEPAGAVQVEATASPAVSIIIATFNHADFLPGAIKSALAHAADDIEVIVIDDGSTDDTHQVVQPFLSRIQYHKQENQRLAGALNAAIARANGRYIRFLDADDVLFPDSLAEQIQLLDRNPNVGLAYGQAHIMDGAGSVYDQRDSPRGIKKTTVFPSRWAFKWMLNGCTISTSSVMVRREVFDKIGLFDRLSVPGEDWDMWMRIAAYYDVAYLPRPLCYYRIHQNSITAKYEVDEVIRTHQHTLQQLFGRPDLPYQDLEASAYARLDRTVALVAARGRARRAYLKHIVAALRSEPSMIFERNTWGVFYEGAKLVLPAFLRSGISRVKRSIARRRNQSARLAAAATLLEAIGPDAGETVLLMTAGAPIGLSALISSGVLF